jgi:hypothetical protein
MAKEVKLASRKGGTRRRWLAAVALGCLAVAATCVLFRAPAAPLAPPVVARPTLGLRPPHGEGSDPVSAEEAEFGDPTPLFMPTRWNSSQKALPRRETYGSFAGFGPYFAFDRAMLALNLPPPIAVPAGASEALETNPPGNPFLGIGRADAPAAALPPRQARVEVVAEGSGRRVFRVDLPPGSVPALDGREWQFLDLMGVADASGFVGPLVPARRAGVQGGNYFPSVDGEALMRLEKELTGRALLGLRLTPGFYRISVGP